MPGIMSSGRDLIIVVIPDESCTAETAYPRMLFPA
jgi:hypothetical protein